MRNSRPITKRFAYVGLSCLALPMASCTPQAGAVLTSPTSDFGANGVIVPRAIQVGFVNNTPFRAIFSFGSYDPLDKETVPTNSGQIRLEGNTSSAQIAQPCRKAFSVGDPELIRLIDENKRNPALTITDERAVIDGINFSGAPAGDPLAAEPTEGTALGRVVQNGLDFTCERVDILDVTGTGLLLFTFEEDATAPGGFRIDFQFVTP